ncbi:MAG: EAL domain-containing protein [Acholeplasmatales bacterium]|nr:EAL domain-containing protein [Acholeplasmatales bacterium]
MNIMLQIAGVFVMIVIFIFYFNDRKAAVKSNKLFLYQSIFIFISLFLDITSIVLINTPGLSYSIFSVLCGKLYLISVLGIVYCGLYYVLLDVKFPSTSKMLVTNFSFLGVILIGVVLILVLPLNIVYDHNGLNDYTEGAPVIITYIETIIFMGLTLGFAIGNKKNMYRKRFIGVCIFLSVWLLGAAVQGLINYVFADLGVIVLCVSFAETLGALVIYIMLENPSLNLDRVTGALNQRAFEEYLDSFYGKKNSIELLVIDYDNAIASSIMGNNVFSKAVTELLREFNPDKIFKNDRDNFIIIRDNFNDETLAETIVNFKEHLYRKNNIVSEIPFKVIQYKNVRLFNGKADLLKSIEYMIDNCHTFENEITVVSKDVADTIHKRFEMVKKCDLAFSKKRVEVFLQPIYSNNDLVFTSAEALVRLRDEDGKLIYPGDFIEDMEHDGRIVELCKMVFDDVCKFISENNMEELGLEYIEVNLSAVQCMQENLAKSYIDIMEKYNINPKYINLEITETGQSTRLTLLKNMEILKQYGVSFSLDDFGTGNSNLNYVIEMPVKIVKFDKSMVNSYFDNRIASFVMNSTIDMIKGLGHKIVFEGIENQDQINQVKNMKVDYIQGYFYSKPIDKESFIKFIRENNL